MKAACGIGPAGDRQTEYDRMVASFGVFPVPEDLQADILEALHSDRWDWYRDCDGCTAVSEMYWPSKYFPPCLRHDFDCITGHGGLSASVRFYRLQRVYGMSPFRSGLRAGAVTVAWYGWYQWRR